MRCGIWLALLVGTGCADSPLIHDLSGFQRGMYSHRPTQTYHSNDITSPLFNYDTWRKDLLTSDESSHIFFDLRYRNGGPYVFRDDDLSLVYAHLDFSTVMNTRVQNVKGKDYLSFWHGAKFGGRGDGFCVFYDSQYQVKFNITVLGRRVRADFHECQVTPDGNVILTAYEDKEFDLSSLGVHDSSRLADSCFQEVDIETNALKFSWCASDHFHPNITFQQFYRRDEPDSESEYKSENEFDYEADNEFDYETLSSTTPPTEGLDTYHINSIQKTLEGNYLVSLRASKLITYINGTSGKPIWNLGGKPNNFTDITPRDVLEANPGSDGALSFGWQHVVRFRDDSLTQISLFDNHNTTTLIGCVAETCSRGRILQIDTSDPQNLTVELIRDYRSHQSMVSQVMGSMQILDSQSNSSNIFIGWGSIPEFTEHTFDGTLARDIQYSPLDPRHAFNGLPGVNSYRVFKHNWHGYPLWAPSVALGENGELWVSWNGATEVKEWAIHGGEDKYALGPREGSGYGSDRTNEPLMKRKPLQVVRRAGFETEIPIDHVWMPYIKLAALNFMGNVIGTSDLIELDLPSLACGLDCISLQSTIFP